MNLKKDGIVQNFAGREVAAPAQVKPAGWRRYLYRVIGAEISTLTRYYDRLIEWRLLPNASTLLFESTSCPSKLRVLETEALPDVSDERDKRTAVLINGALNHSLDIQGLLEQVRGKLSRTSRVVIVGYNPYLSWLYRLANRLGFRRGEEPCTFVTKGDIANLARLSGFELVRMRPVGYVPFRMLGLGSLLNSILPTIPGLRQFAFAHVIVLRPVFATLTERPSLSIIIPARNERGNIENALTRMPDLGTKLEIIYVEGHSNDGTWEEIERVQAKYRGKFDVKAYRQTGKGKVDAVRLGFSKASCDVLTILDADLTMPPELLGRFYDAYCGGLADFINGSRLVYPMEGEAMRFLNRLGNIFFAKAVSSVLETQLGDSLCGTKLLARHDYERMVKWRGDFGDFDPFGDFELLFPAATLALGLINVPVHYRARTYGTTQIHRFRHGLMLLKMTLIGFFRIRTGK